MSEADSRRMAEYYDRRRWALRDKQRQLDRDYDELNRLLSRIHEYEEELGNAEAKRGRILNNSASLSKQSVAYGEYRQQMQSLLSEFGNARMKLDKAVGTVLKKIAEVRAASERNDYELQRAEELYHYWNNKANLGE